MSGSDRILVDTNLFIFLLAGNENAAEAMLSKAINYSFITEIELLGNSNVSLPQEKIIREILSFNYKQPYSPEIERMTIAIKKVHKIKIPDAIIAATAIGNDIPLLTSDKGFGKVKDLRCVVFEV